MAKIFIIVKDFFCKENIDPIFIGLVNRLRITIIGVLIGINCSGIYLIINKWGEYLENKKEVMYKEIEIRGYDVAEIERINMENELNERHININGVIIIKTTELKIKGEEISELWSKIKILINEGEDISNELSDLRKLINEYHALINNLENDNKTTRDNIINHEQNINKLGSELKMLNDSIEDLKKTKKILWDCISSE